MNYGARLKRLVQAAAKEEIGALLVTHPANVRYLCGFTGSAGALVITEHENVLITDGRYKTQARNEVRGAQVVTAKKGFPAAIAELLGTKSGRKRRCLLGIAPEHTSVAERDRLEASLPTCWKLRSAPSLVERLRMIKDASELELIRKAVLLAARLFDDCLKSIRAGVTERDIAAELEYAAGRHGAEGMAFETIIASGERSALPHGRASSATVPASGFVVCDLGVILAGYCSDMTRSIYVGRAARDAGRFYGAVLEAQLAGVDAVRPGVTVNHVDAAARKVLRRAGLARYFTHSTGHGVGLEIHEAPRIAAGQADVLQPGMVITIEPGAYVPGKWGVRIEDMVVVTETGCEVLTPTTKQLLTV
ncbi:MAG TPA: Xaa-Pro peptidase family protein [Terriglobales bacterium]|nr:Xaa-Pro peptidase family protein [Terriglobales bacterium]